MMSLANWFARSGFFALVCLSNRTNMSGRFEGISRLASVDSGIRCLARLDETDAEAREGYRRLYETHGFDIDANNPGMTVLFPEMDETVEVPEITTACWGILGKSPRDVMCASSRMVVKRKGADKPVVLSCTLLPYDPAFEMGETLAEAEADVSLNHPHCAKFCVLGGASCSG